MQRYKETIKSPKNLSTFNSITSFFFYITILLAFNKAADFKGLVIKDGKKMIQK